MNNLIIFIVLSIPIVILSWRAILKPLSHGFFRFIGWECIIWLLIKNIRFWFVDPLGVYQVIAWISLIYSLVLLIPGVHLMRKMGKPKDRPEDSTLYTFEQTTELIESGIFKYVRHPLYGSLIFLTWGIFFKNPDITLLIVSLIATKAFILTARIEEKENIAFFGDRYIEYMDRSKMFIPFIL